MSGDRDKQDGPHAASAESPLLRPSADAPPGRRTLVDRRYGFQRKAARTGGTRSPASSASDTDSTLAAASSSKTTDDPFKLHLVGDEATRAESAQAFAAQGVSGRGSPLPHAAQLEKAFGTDLSGVQAHVGGAAADACQQLGAHAYATGNQIAFASAPDLRLAAHETTHAFQQAAGVQLKSDVGEAGDEYEREADELADRVVRGERVTPPGSSIPTSAKWLSGGPTVQKQPNNAFADDPLADLGDSTLRVRPGPVRVETVGIESTLAAARAGQWSQVRSSLDGRAMKAILEILGRARAEGLLDRIAANVPDPRIQLATLTAQMQIGLRWRARMQQANEADAEACREHVRVHIEAGDLGVHKPLIGASSTNQGRTFSLEAADDATWLDQFLDFFHLEPNAVDGAPQFNGRRMARIEIVDTTVEQAALAGRMVDPSAVGAVVERKLAEKPRPPRSPTGAKKASMQSQIAIGYSMVLVGHSRVGRVEPGDSQHTVDNPNQQLALQYTIQLHDDGAPGWEVSIMGQVTAFPDRGSRSVRFSLDDLRVQSVVGGLGGAYVKPLVKDILQFQQVIQAAAGVAFDRQERAEGTMYALPATFQVAAQPQLVFNLIGKDDSKFKLQVIALGQAGVTHSDDKWTIDYGGGVGIQFSGTL